MPNPLPHNALVLVADGRKMLLLRNHGDAARIDLRTEAHEERTDAKDSELKTDLAGQSPAPGNTGLGGGTMGETDYHQQDENRFAADAAERVKAMALAGEFDALTVIAAPKTLGELRKHWHKEVERRILDEIAKDMTGRPLPDIEALLTGEAAPPG